jgi:hypothetical protein
MAGQPVTRNQIQHINSLGPEGEETILSLLAGGKTVKDVAEWLGFPRHSLRSLYQWRDETPERQAAWRQAIVHRAQTLAEDSLEIADTAQEGPDAIRKAELRVKVRHWLAGVSDPENYGKDKAAKLTINVATMHLTAVEAVNKELQQRAIARLRAGAEASLPAPDARNAQIQGADVVDADYEVVEDDDSPEDPYADDEEDNLLGLL